MTLEIPRALYEAMLAHCEQGAPDEACGVLAGHDPKVAQVFPMANAERSPMAYRFDEREQLGVFAQVEDRGMEILAFFHSHTHTEAFPSPTDRRQAHWTDPVSGEMVPAFPGMRYVIVSLAEEEPVTRAFRFEAGEPVEEEVRIV